MSNTPDLLTRLVLLVGLCLFHVVAPAPAAGGAPAFSRTPFVGTGPTVGQPPPWLARSAAAPADSGGGGPRKPERSARTAGMIIGGVAGGGLGTLIALYGQALCEGDCADPDVGYFAAWIGGGLLIGAATGYLVGSFLGSLVPPSDPIPPAEPVGGLPPPGKPSWQARPREPGDPPTGSIGFDLLGGRYTNRPANDPGFGGRISLLRHPAHSYSYGVEVSRLAVDGGIGSYGVVLRRHWSRRSLRPGLVLGAAVNTFRDSNTLIGASLGAGIEQARRPGDNAWRLEGRYHWSLQRSEFSNSSQAPYFRHLTLALGYRFGW